MSAISMRASLQKIGEPRPGKPIPAFPSGFYSAPRSLRAALRATNLPQMEGWANTHTREFDEGQWRNECNGLTTDGQAWYLASNNPDFRGIHKYSLNFSQFLGKVELPLPSSEPPPHVGDIDYFNGIIYVPISTPDPPKVWEIDRNLVTQRITDLPAESVQYLGWCAINPWNGYLYTAQGGDGVVSVRAYDPNNGYQRKQASDIHLGGDPVNEIQGGCFSSNGHLYLTSDKFVGNHNGTKDIRAYSALNGEYLGRCPVDYDHEDWDWYEPDAGAEELEGIAICHLVHPGGDSTYVHVVILDNDAGPDDVYMKRFAVPNPDAL